MVDGRANCTYIHASLDARHLGGRRESEAAGRAGIQLLHQICVAFQDSILQTE